MISHEDKINLLEIAGKYKVSKLYLFDSSTDSDIERNDIDIGVEGIDDKVYFKFYSGLIFSLSKPVDLIDLRKKSLFNETVKSKGILLNE